jgi:heptosyltransferase-2
MIRSEGAPRRLLVRMPNWLGDVVMALPALAAVRRAWPDAHITAGAFPSVAPIFEEETDAAPNEILVLEKATEREQLRAGSFDAVLLLTNSFRTAWVARRSAIPNRWGFAASGRSLLLTKAVKRPRGQVHQSAYYLRLVRGLGIGAPKAEPRIVITPRTRERAARFLEDAGVPPGATIVGFAPGAAYGHAKRWPPERVARVVARLTKERGVTCVLVGAAGDREAGREIESSLPPGVHAVNLIGRTDLRLLAGVLGACRAFVSNDSGAMHLAAAVGVPVTAIFGPTNEKATAPIGDHDIILQQVFCRPCMLRECPIDHRCMKRIGANQVYEAVVRRLERHA